MLDIEIAVAVATAAFHDHPNYPQKLIHKYPAPLVEPSDLHGFWYEALFTYALKEPVKARERKLLLVMAYRHMLKMLRSRNRLKNIGPSEWNCQDENKRKYYHDFLQWQELLDEDNMEDEAYL
jgi:hypothetical protein